MILSLRPESFIFVPASGKYLDTITMLEAIFPLSYVFGGVVMPHGNAITVPFSVFERASIDRGAILLDFFSIPMLLSFIELAEVYSSIIK